MIALDRVSFAYTVGEARKVALREVTFSLSPGEFVAVIGPNGSGKSTLVRLLNGLLLPDRGEVRVDGYSPRDPGQLREVRSRVGMLFQNPENQIVAGTVEDDVAFGMENLGLPRDEMRRRVKSALDAVGLEGMEGALSHSLSGGEKQRLALAGLLAMRPRYLILDEPTTMLDPLGREELRARIAGLHSDPGIGVLLVTHAMDEAALARRVVLLADGEIVRDAAPVEIFADRPLLERTRMALPGIAALAGELVERGIPLPLPQLSLDGFVAALEGVGWPGAA